MTFDEVLGVLAAGIVFLSILAAAGVFEGEGMKKKKIVDKPSRPKPTPLDHMEESLGK